jgi:hypothetical protein
MSERSKARQSVQDIGQKGSERESRLTYSVPEFGKAIGVSRNTAYGAVRRGQVPVIHIAGRILIPRIAVERMLDAARSE